MEKSYTTGNHFNIEDLAYTIKSFLQRNKKMTAQVFNDQDSNWIIQGKEDRSWKKKLAMDKAVTIRLELSGYTLHVKLGAGKWMDKAAGVAVAMLIAWPVLIPTALGAYQQKSLFNEIERFIDNYMLDNSSRSFIQRESASNPAVYCSNCGKAVSSESKFCSTCGNPII